MKKMYWFLFSFFLYVGAIPAFAQEPGAAGSAVNWVALASGFSMAIASAFCGLAQGKATAAAVEGIARNPGAAAAIRVAFILGLALIESLALYTLVIIFAKVR